MASENRAPTSAIEGTGVVGLFSAIGVAVIATWHLSAEWSAVVAIGMPMLGNWLRVIAANYFEANLGDIIKPSARLIPLFLTVGLGYQLLGCGGNLTVAQCLERVEAAKAAKLGCGYFPDEADQNKCMASADIAIASAQLGCQWAKPDEAVPE